MNKLGFVLKIVSLGASEILSCNNGEWKSNVVDVREFLKLFDGLYNTNNTVSFVSFDDSGCLLTLMKSISGRSGDYLSGWVYIPFNLDISDEDIMMVYDFVRRIIGMSNISEIKSEIETTFAKEYNTKDPAFKYKASSGDKLGYRFYKNNEEFKNLLGTNRYQSYYSDYKTVFLLKEDSGVTIAHNYQTLLDDLTKKRIIEMCILRPAAPDDVRKLGGEVRLMLNDRKDFLSPIQREINSKIQLYAQKPGFDPAPLPLIDLDKLDQIVTLDGCNIVWKKHIQASMFKLYYNGKPLIESRRTQIFVNGKNITNKDYVLTEDECKKAKVVIDSEDYKFEDDCMDISQERVTVEMKKKIITHKYTIRLSSGASATMQLSSDEPSLFVKNNQSPLVGYSLRQSFLKLSSVFVWKQRFYGFLGGLVLFFLVVLFQTINMLSDDYKLKWGVPPWQKIRSEQEYQPTQSIESIDDISKSPSRNVDREKGDASPI